MLVRAILLSSAVILVSATQLHAQTGVDLNVLGWCDVEDPKVLRPFEEAHNVTVKVKTHEDASAANNILQTSAPGEWDVVHTDTAYVPQHVTSGLLEPLDKNNLPLTDFVSSAVRADLNQVNGIQYGLTNKMGVESIVYDSSRVSADEVSSLNFMFDDKYKGRIGIWDFYVLGIQLVAMSQGLDPSKLNEGHIPLLREKLTQLKSNIAMIGDPAASMTAIASGDIDIMLGGGDWLGKIMAENKNMRWTVPKEGGLFYLTSAAVVKGTTKAELANDFVKYLASPEGQALLATADCYWGAPVNKKTVLDPKVAEILNLNKLEELLSRSHLQTYWSGALDKQMQTLWAEFLQK